MVFSFEFSWDFSVCECVCLHVRMYFLRFFFGSLFSICLLSWSSLFLLYLLIFFLFLIPVCFLMRVRKGLDYKGKLGKIWEELQEERMGNHNQKTPHKKNIFNNNNNNKKPSSLVLYGTHLTVHKQKTTHATILS